ncbi:glycosyltransferase family A protein [Agarivorans aestuarii]|uniref:Glycosyltransferase family A protein n=1 Tax=Agarivorans aestuarii TaxID=1563703 RepID=A0ABU7G063_9ALTE|nr:glycosyltransferase family A protein [Agarivorans aestuarii]MEE1672813.1 glycosyltransferase family A protein [Agarivorans aestuarii]
MQSLNKCRDLLSLFFTKNRLQGAIDIAKNGVLYGWLYDSTSTVDEQFFCLYVNDEFFGQFRTSVSRPDLKIADTHKRCLGFAIPLCPSVLHNDFIDVKVIMGKDVEIANRVSVFNESYGYSEDFSLRDYLVWAELNHFVPYGKYELSYQLKKDIGEYLRNIKASAKNGSSLFFSVILPTYNRANVLWDAIGSLVEQSHRNFELIIIDDASEDNTSEIIDEIVASLKVNIKSISLRVNRGVSWARNEALKLATGDIICFLDSDNIWASDYLEILNIFYQQNSSCQCVYTGLEIWDSDSYYYFYRTSLLMRPYSRALLEKENFIDLNCFSHRRFTGDDSVKFSTSLNRLVDWDYILNITRFKEPKFIPIPLVSYHRFVNFPTITNSVDFQSNYAQIVK